ncbi:hypothetical protein ACU4HD_44145 [Cupriavidus basilensis]
MKKTDLENSRASRSPAISSRDAQRTGKPGQGTGKAIPQNKLLKALLGKPTEDDPKKSEKSLTRTPHI